MKILKDKLLVFIVLIIAVSCDMNMENISMQDIENDSALIKTEQCGEFLFTCRYRPPRYLAMKELCKLGNAQDDTTGLCKEIVKYSKGLYFDVRIELNSKSNTVLHKVSGQSEYAARIDYLNNKVYQDFALISEQLIKSRTLGHSFQNTFGASNVCDINLVFSKQDKDQEGDMNLVYNDRIFGIKEKIRFKYSIKDLKKYQY